MSWTCSLRLQSLELASVKQSATDTCYHVRLLLLCQLNFCSAINGFAFCLVALLVAHFLKHISQFTDEFTSLAVPGRLLPLIDSFTSGY
jgi:hypothetical protein